MRDDTKPMKAPALERFYSYAHKDEQMRKKLEEHLAVLQQQGLIASWHDRQIGAGTEWAQQIDEHLNRAHIILLLISASFLASPYCTGIEMQRAMQRHDAKEARVIPIILRPVHWQDVPFARLQLLPTDGKAIASSHWRNQDEAFANVVAGIRKAIEELALIHGESSTGAHQFPPSPSLPSSPSIWNVPFRRNFFFTGRETLLTHVHDRLTSSKAAALTQAQAISGLGGIGKTQIALEYAYRYKQDYQAIFWVRAANRENIVTDLTEIARRLALPEKDEQNQDLVVAAVQHWLMAHSTWLLIFDNADEPHIVADFLPSSCSGHILLTTRARAMGNLAESIEVENMTQQEGRELVLRRARILKQGMSLQQVSPQDQLTAQRIVQAMDGLPLALDQAGAYIEEMGCRLADYLTLYTTSRKELLKHGSTLASHATVATTFTLALQQVNQTNAAAADLLRFLAFLDPDTIPEELIVEGAFALGTTLQTVVQNPLTFQATLGLLRNFSLIRRNADTATLAMHRLVQAVIKDELNKKTQRQWAHSQRYLAHAQVCQELITQWDITLDEASTLLCYAGVYLRNRGHYQEAAPFLQDALAIGETRDGRDHPGTRYLLNNLALLYSDQGKYEQARPLYERALAISEKVLGHEHPTTKRVRENYTMLLQKMGQKTDGGDEQNGDR